MNLYGTREVHQGYHRTFGEKSLCTKMKPCDLITELRRRIPIHPYLKSSFGRHLMIEAEDEVFHDVLIVLNKNGPRPLGASETDSRNRRKKVARDHALTIEGEMVSITKNWAISFGLGALFLVVVPVPSLPVMNATTLHVAAPLDLNTTNRGPAQELGVAGDV